MASLADGELDARGFDRVARALRDNPELSAVDWDWVVHRAQELALEAPLFFDSRTEIAKALTDAEDQRRALAIAARFVGGGRDLADEPRAVLGALASAFGIPEHEHDHLLRPSGVTDSTDLGFVRAAFNAPEAENAPSLFEALRSASDDGQRRLLLFKLSAIRKLIWRLGAEPRPELVKVGEPLRFDDLRFRVDAILEHGGRRKLVRCVASGEALHRGEHALLRRLADRLPETADLLVVHEGRLSPEDESFIRGVDPARLSTVELVPPSDGPG